MLGDITRTFVANVYVGAFRETAGGEGPDGANQEGSTTPQNHPSAKKHDRKYADDDERCNHVPSQVTMVGILHQKQPSARVVGWSQWVDATLSSNPTCIENKG